MRLRPSALVLGALTLGACSVPTVITAPANLSSFSVETAGVYVRVPIADGGGIRVPLGVSSSCKARFDGGMPPTALRGTADCRYVIPRGQVEIDITAKSLDRNGQPLTSFSGPVAFKVLPGDLAPSVRSRWSTFDFGTMSATVKAVHQYGEVRVWVEDAPPELSYDAGGLPNPDDLPVEPALRTFASGLSPTIYFEDQTLQSMQLPDGADNRSSPFVGEFVTVGKNPESGERLLQNCADDPARNGVQSLMVVTGVDPSGFFITDLTACRLVEVPIDPLTGRSVVRTPEPLEPCIASLPDGGSAPIEQTTEATGICRISRHTCIKNGNTCQRYMPGTYAHMFVYNYNYPDGLNVGDLLFTVSGSVQEFTSTSQMVFPGWTIAESVRLLPPDQWNKWLNFVPPVDLNGRICGLDDAQVPFVTDVLCGMSTSNLKLESLESALVRVRGVKMPDCFSTCDFNGNATVPFFCNRTDRGEQGTTIASWGNCDFDPVPKPELPNDAAERTCLQNCVLTRGPDADLGVCSEGSTFEGFGQFVVEMAPAGPAYANLDDSLPKRSITVPIALADGGVATPVKVTGLVVDTTKGYEDRASIAAACDVPVHYRLGDDSVVAVATDPVLPAKTPLTVRMAAGQTAIAFARVNASGSCSVSYNPHMRINLLTKDAVPELSVDCSPTDPNAEKAQQCRDLQGATFDVIGHLRQVQPARPRWMVIPRDPDDICCYPGAGLECPKPIKPCITAL